MYFAESMTSPSQHIIDKYGDIIREEVNIKELAELPSWLHITKSYAPVWSKLSAGFGKDTGKIIAAAKAGQVEEIGEGRIRVSDGTDTRELAADEYELRYEWLNEDTQAVEEGVIVELDLHISDELRDEGVAREISRFLNQMRKTADYNVDDRVALLYTTNSDYIKKIISSFGDMLKNEALLKDIQESSEMGDIEDVFENEGEKATCRLKR